MLSSCAIWVIIFRIASGIYPHYVELLATGLGTEELRAVTQALAQLPQQVGLD
ncbi:MAG: hypothetical protein HZB26_21795 [Candidatus Hydrogenedentes bacterium]|nr:hypothetical protein [Candidatus Hydrogenedentota bacterium]